MGRMLGAFDRDDEMDRPDLNKCPDCGCFFAGDPCPLCGKPCPEAFRAGNRKSVRVKKAFWRTSRRPTAFIDWYHRWWFIILMMFLFPLAGVILLITSPHKRAHKIIFVVVAVLYTILTTIGIGNIVHYVRAALDPPVDTSLSREEYIAACEAVEPEVFYRSSDAYTERFVTMTLVVQERFTDGDAYYQNEKYTTYYLCTGEQGESFLILMRDCVQDAPQNLIPGDRITVWGEGAGTQTVYDMEEYLPHTAPCLHVAYLTVTP